MIDRNWTQFGTGLIADCMGRFGAVSGDVKRLVGGELSGPAVTVEVAAGENGTIHRALMACNAGDVLVVAAGGYTDRAVWGEILARAALALGLAGVVIDGAVRDMDRLSEIGLPTFARGSTPMGPHKGWPGRIGLAVACGGTVIHPRDQIVGDADGIVVVPVGRLDEMYAAASDRLQLERNWINRIEGGETTISILGLDEEVT